jgi:hypothetical protein
VTFTSKPNTKLEPGSTSRSLVALGREGRLAAYRRGDLSFELCCRWAARYPHEVPLVNGEFEFIARTTPEVCE